jgi:hypothetical protein
MEDQLQRLLEKMDVVRIRQQLAPPSQEFNVFTILRQESDEVNLHSRFLYELLSPTGSHHMGATFLKLFASVCKLPTLSYDTIQVKREHANIDLLIQDNQRSIVIENKIYAGDQHEQMKRYHEYAKSLHREPTLYYLTLNGNELSDWSRGDMKTPVQLLSYTEHIDNWLTECIKESVVYPALRETIIQYQTLIRRLSNKTMDNTEKQAILDLMNQNDNAERAAIIARNWRHVQWHTEWDFWNELLSLAKSVYLVPTEGQFSDDAIDRMVDGGRGKNPYYGIIFSIGTLSSNNVRLKIERGWDILYYGIIHCSEDIDIRARMTGSIQHLGTATNEHWVGYKNTTLGINLQDFDNSIITQQLANKAKRQVIVRELWNEVELFIQATKVALTKEFGIDFEATPLSTSSQ